MNHFIILLQLITLVFFALKAYAGQSLGNDIIILVVIFNVIAIALISFREAQSRNINVLVSLIVGVFVVALHFTGYVCQGRTSADVSPSAMSIISS